MAHRAKRDGEWKEMFSRLHAAGKIRIANFDHVIDYITNGLHGIMFSNAFQTERSDLGARTEESLDMLLYGIFTPRNS
jgi:hypothetical protein